MAGKVPVLVRVNATVLAVLLALVAPGVAQARADDAALLARHAPELRYDARERGFATAVEALTPRVAGDAVTLRPRVSPLPDVVYGRVVRERGGAAWLQFWFLYADNPQDRGIVRTGRHEGDWELVQVRVDARGRAREATYAQHGWAARCGYDGRVFVAHGSHASYARAGEHGRPWPDPDDEARGDGRAVRPEVRPFGAWVRWPGRWGRTEAGWVPAESDSPRGPAFQETAAWRDPAGYHAAARPCAAGAPPHPWPVYAGAATGAVLLLAGALLARRRLKRRG
ncbi:MAG TPA: hypothetical protein VN238_15295 [Solirubrobacteraceae bacterium]|nr:hypothetical protein [Solirubrobacteraceae bacterium]